MNGFDPTKHTLTDFLYALIGLFDPLIVLLAAIAVAVFIWGVIKYIHASGDPKQLKEGSKYLMFGVFALVVIVGLWGIVKFFTGLLGLEYAGPQFNSRGGSGTTNPTTPGGGVTNPTGPSAFGNTVVPAGYQVSGVSGAGTSGGGQGTTANGSVAGTTGGAQGSTQTSGTGVNGSSGAGTSQTRNISGSTQGTTVTQGGTQGTGQTGQTSTSNP
jgi:hypothetical protein